MSSSAEGRRAPRRRVLRTKEAASLPIASIVSSRSDFSASVLSAGAFDADEVPGEPDTVEEERRAAFESGRAAGRAEALAGIEAARAAAAARTAVQIGEAAVAVAGDRQAIVAEVVGEAVDLAFGLVDLLVGRELETRLSPTRDAVVRALTLVPEGEDLVVRVHPGAELSAAELGSLCAGTRVAVREDAGVEAGGCVVEAGACRVDAQIGPALDRVRAILDRVRAEAGDGHERGEANGSDADAASDGDLLERLAVTR